MRVIINLVHQALLFTVLFWPSVLPAIVAIANRTIDDTSGDSVTNQRVLYQPTTAGVWKGAECTDCLIQPDTSQAHWGTYTAATYNPGLGSVNFTLNFHGTAIYVFFILANNAGPGVTTLTAANFTLDDQPPQLKLHVPDVTTTEIQYNALLYSQTGLPAAQHSLLVSTSGDNDVYINFDYAIYTRDDSGILVASPSPPASPSASASSTVSTSIPFNQSSATAAPSHTTIPLPTYAVEDNSAGSNGGAIAGGIIGALLAIALVVVIIFLLRRRQKRLDTEQLLFRKVEIDPAEPANANASDVGYSTLSSESGHSYSAASMNPFHHETTSVASTTRLTLQVPNVRPPPMSQVPATPSEAGDPYGGYLTPTSASVVPYPNPDSNRPARDQRAPLQLINRSSTVPTLASSVSNHEDLRRARQEELRRQLVEMQQEMLHLSSGLHDHAPGANGEGGVLPEYVKRISAKSPKAPAGTVTSSSSTAVGGLDDDAEVKVEDMQELVRSLRLQIEYLQLQQQSAWAQGLSDDPPPGYTSLAARRMSSSSIEKH